MSAPVYDRALYRPNEKMNGQQCKHPPVRCEREVKKKIRNTETNTHEPAVADAVDQRPDRVISLESWFRFGLIAHKILVNAFGFHHQSPDILDEMR